MPGRHPKARPKVSQWLAAPLPDDVRRAVARLTRDDDVQRVAVMPDVHLSREVCVGLAVATKARLIPAAVGGDIGCGMSALAFDAPAALLSSPRAAARLLQHVSEVIPITRHRRAEASLPDALARRPLSSVDLEATKRREAALQFATLGRGNHFVEFQADEDGGLWLMVHSGSRGMGQAIREFHEQRGRRTKAGVTAIEAASPPGRAYLSDVRWALDYAAASRAQMVDRAARILSERFGICPRSATRFDCHHNFVRRERHDESLLWVHRKGAISADDGEPGIIPGSMGAPSFHVLGRGCAAALRSSSHGAGRVMSRSVARRRIGSEALHASMQGIWFDHRLTGRLCEEAPAAYKDIGAVMRAQRELTRRLRRLTPVVVFKGG